MLYGFLIFVHVIVSVALVVAVLMQSSKGGGLAGSLGGSGMSGGVFGGRGAAPFLIKATTVLAVMFMLTSISLNLVSNRSQSTSVLERTLSQPGTAADSAPLVTDEMPITAPADEDVPALGDDAGSAE